MERKLSFYFVVCIINKVFCCDSVIHLYIYLLVLFCLCFVFHSTNIVTYISVHCYTGFITKFTQTLRRNKSKFLIPKQFFTHDQQKSTEHIFYFLYSFFGECENFNFVASYKYFSPFTLMMLMYYAFLRLCFIFQTMPWQK